MGGTQLLVLNKLSMHIAPKEMVAITGSSGSGKSTLMNILGCLTGADSGSYILDGENVSDFSKQQLATIRNRRIGFVFQSFNLLPRLNALQNVELPLLYARDVKAREKAKAALDRVGLSDRMDHHPNQLSGGQCQRVAIARAIVGASSIILADEPTGAVDSKTSSEIMSLFKSLNDDERTIVIITHDHSVAEQCHRQIYLKDGMLEHVGDTKGANL